MKVAYFDCFAGISGDMTLGALISAGADFEYIKGELEKLPLTDYDIHIETKSKMGIYGYKFDVSWSPEKNHNHRHLRHIFEIIDQSTLSNIIKDKSKGIFLKLAEAEAKIHNTTVEKIHFHEVGAVDSIIDIVGSVIALDYLKIEKVFCSPLPITRGFVKCDHGLMPSPAPATFELIKDFTLIEAKDINGEIITPTGAAILAYLAEEGFPTLTSTYSIGYGAGTKDLSIPNMLRVIIGETKDNSPSKETKEEVLVLETNIDDMNPEIYDYLFQGLLKRGALDVFTTPIQMKKNRPANKLTVIIEPSQLKEMKELILKESSTLGVRYRKESRTCLDREIINFNTPFGLVRVKIGLLKGEIIQIAPEYEDCKLIAQNTSIPLKIIYDRVKSEFYNNYIDNKNPSA